MSAAAAVLAASGAAATTYTESGGDYGDDFNTRTFLPDDSTEVQGYVYYSNLPNDYDTDWIAWTDLQAGGAFSIEFHVAPGGDFGASLSLYDESQNQIDSTGGVAPGGQATMTGTIPGSGQLVAQAVSGPDYAQDDHRCAARGSRAVDRAAHGRWSDRDVRAATAPLAPNGVRLWLGRPRDSLAQAPRDDSGSPCLASTFNEIAGLTVVVPPGWLHPRRRARNDEI